MADESASPAVTVVMIFLDAQAYIVEAVESVLAQTRADWELVMVDDGSTDGSTAIARDYAARHPGKIRYLEHEDHRNLGMSASRNAGVAAGRGRYISFLDSDDIWLPPRLERFLAAAEQYPDAGMVYGPTLYWYSWAEERGMVSPVPGQADFPGHLDLPPDVQIPPPHPLRRFLQTGGGCLPGICSLLIRRDAFVSVGGFEPTFRGLYEDQVFLSKMVVTHPVVIVDEILDYYRQHSESCCYRAIETGDYHPENLHPARERYLVWLDGYIREQGIKDRVIRREIAAQLRPYKFRLYGLMVDRAKSTVRAAKRIAKERLPRPVVAWLKAIARRGRGGEAL